MFDRRSWDVWKLMLAAWLGALAIMTAPGLVLGRVGPADMGTGRILIMVIPLVFAMVWAVWLATLAFRRLDEFQQEAGKFAWYWGGSIGMAVSVIGYAFVGMGGLHWLDPAHFGMGKDLFRAFQLGYLLGLGFPVLGFVVARLWWQLSKR